MLKSIIFILFTVVLSASTSQSKFLTLKEKQWLKKFGSHIKVGITQIPNQVLKKEDGTFSGFSIELFNLIEKKTPLHFDYIYFQSWNKLLEAAKNKKIDVVFFAQKTSSRLKYFYFTDTVLTQQNKLITNIHNNLNSLEKLKKHKLALTKGSALEEYIHFYYPEIIVVSTKDELQSLKFVSNNKADATILELVRSSYYIRQFNLKNLIISSDINYNYYLSIASIKSLPELNIILSKTLQAIPQKDIEALKLKWGYIKEQKLFFDTQTMIYLAIAFGIIIPFSLYLFVINKKLQKEINAKEKAMKKLIQLRDSKLNEMSEVISMIAHQWKQPLNNLSLLNQLCESKFLLGKVDDKFKQYFFTNTKEQITLMSKTIDDFKDFFKVDEDKKKFDLVQTINNLLDITKPLYEKNNISIVFQHSDINFTTLGYQSILFQLLLNILNNAKDALLETKNKNKLITITLSQEKGKNIIEIEDNAGGIPEDIIDKIFNPYFSTKKEKNGTGLGLYMAKTIIEERMNGSIEVQNKEAGALFTIMLP